MEAASPPSRPARLVPLAGWLRQSPETGGARPPGRLAPVSPRGLAAAVTLLLVIAGCGGGSSDGTKTVREPRGTVTVGKGQTLVLTFSTNPGVGFDWERGTPNP